MKKKSRVGSSFDGFLKEEGTSFVLGVAINFKLLL